jgi:hypothetical protein
MTRDARRNAGLVAGTVSPEQFFSDDSIGRILGAARETVG